MVWYFIGVYIINRTLHAAWRYLIPLLVLKKYFKHRRQIICISARPCNIFFFFFFAYGISNYACNRSLYYIDVQVFGGKLAKNSFTRCWIFACFHVRWYIPWVSWYGGNWSLQGSSYICTSGWNLTFFVTRHLIKSLLHKERNVAKNFRQRSWFGEKFVPQTAYLSSEVNKYTAELSFGSSRFTLSRRAH